MNNQKTILQDFLEKYPNAKLRKGIPRGVCAEGLGYCVCDIDKSCFDCWNTPMGEVVKMSEWISVKDRLPEKQGHYLVFTSINYWKGGCNENNPNWFGTTKGYENTPTSVLDCFFDCTGDWNRVCNHHVTHWMPLPEPPKRGEHNA